MPADNELEKLIQKRLEEAQAVQAKVRAAERTRQERQAGLNNLAFQFQSDVVASLHGIAAQYNRRLQEAGRLTLKYDQMRCEVRYDSEVHRKTAQLTFAVQESGEVRIGSTLSSVTHVEQLGDLTSQALQAEVEKFLKAALA